MSNYDDALSLIENEANRDCEYYVYSQMRDAVDGMEMDRERLLEENGKLRDLVHDMYAYYASGTLDSCELCDWTLDCENHPALSCKHGCTTDFVEDVFMDRMRELGIEVPND